MTHFAGIPTRIAAALLVLAPVAGHAQTGDRGLAERVRECRALADVGMRTACYDGIVVDGPEPQRQVPPPLADGTRRAGSAFGSNQLPRTPAV